MSEVNAGPVPRAGWPGTRDGRADARDIEIDRIVESLGVVMDQRMPEIPEWVAQELTFGQMRLLFLLNGHGPAPMSRVAEWLGVGLPAASGVVDRVERHGLVTRIHRTDDRRVVECQLTDAGRLLLEEVLGMRRETLRATLGVLTADELSQLSLLITVLLERIVKVRP
jgi:DNA-binding MarR family transcriptional regulator